MFVVPEVLWSPVSNYIFSMSKPLKHGSIQIFRDNFLLSSDNINILSTVLFIQMAGLLLSFIYLLVHHGVIKNKLVLWISCALLFLASVLVFFLFGFSVSLRNIGF